MRKIVMLGLILLGVVAVQAQDASKKQVQISGGVRFALPTGDFHLSHSVGIGAELQAEYKLQPNVSLTATTGYTNFIGKTVSYWEYEYKNSSAGYIPILVGARYYPNENIFVGGKLGLGILTGGGTGTAFNLEPGVGYSTEKLQLGLGLNLLTSSGSLGHLGLTALYKFN